MSGTTQIKCLRTLFALLVAWSTPALAEDILKIGTWNIGPGNGTQDVELTVGGKFVLRAHYETAGPISSRVLGGLTVFEQSLQLAGNGLQLYVPMQSFGSSYVYNQKESQHFALPGVPVPTIQFLSNTLTPASFLGVDFEGVFDTSATATTNGSTNFIEIYSESASLGGPVLPKSRKLCAAKMVWAAIASSP